MIAWINFAVLIFASLFFLYYYVLSVSPATREKVLGPAAYARCGRERIISGLFEGITVVNYVVYVFYPLNTPLPEKFPWAWWVSAILGIVIGIPSVALMVIGMRDAGEETLRPKKEHTLYGGIYTKIRHPQATGEVFTWLAIALLLHSPFLAAFSLIYFPIFLLLCFAEEQDLLWRYGEAYAEYYKSTGAFWPKRRPDGNTIRLHERS
jgi:protein-S-isoprenylcysteine O-methyltransferase Ste14